MIRNFSIIAHINHGKSTLSDRLIEYCDGLSARDMHDQILDSMDIERERGITIKSQTVRLSHVYNDTSYILNLMDTPGHIDFSYEVSRSLAACEGSILLVDATQGVQAQTLSNTYKAIEANHTIIPCINKIDLQSSNVPECQKQIEDILGIDASDAIMVSAKTGMGIPSLCEAIIQRILPPSMDKNTKMQILLVDAWYDTYLGVIMLIRVMHGSIKIGDKIKMIHANAIYTVGKVGIFTPKKTEIECLYAGEIGFICANIKRISDCLIGDTIIEHDDTQSTLLPGFLKVKPVVFCSLYPVVNAEYLDLKVAIEKLALNDSSIEYEYESSSALGSGFRCGFLGLLHMEVAQERLEREFNIDLIATAPSVVYKAIMQDGQEQLIHNPSCFPNPEQIKKILEPIAVVSIITPTSCIGTIIELCTNKRGIQKEINSCAGNRSLLVYHMPLEEIIADFHDTIQSLSKGYASFEWDLLEYKESDIVKVGILINGELSDALSILIHRSRSESRGRNICIKLKELISKQMFAVPIQAIIGGKIIARETISAMRKDVTAKCYGGDISRKRKLLDKQKRGKKKMKMFGNIEIPQEAFIAALKQ